MDYKTLHLDAVSLKFDEGNRKFSGYASVFGGVDSYGDSIVPGAYKNTLTDRPRPIRMRWNHFGPVIGKWLDIREDEKGLYVEGELTPGHSVAENVYASLKHGAVDGMSIGYHVKAYEQRDEVRYLKEIELVEVSVVEEPADLGAKVGDVKADVETINQIETLKDFESYLRDACGFSRKAATALVSRCKRLGDQDDTSALLEKIRAINL